jgi:hypothetical protein
MLHVQPLARRGDGSRGAPSRIFGTLSPSGCQSPECLAGALGKLVVVGQRRASYRSLTTPTCSKKWPTRFPTRSWRAWCGRRRNGLALSLCASLSRVSSRCPMSSSTRRASSTTPCSDSRSSAHHGRPPADAIRALASPQSGLDRASTPSNACLSSSAHTATRASGGERANAMCRFPPGHTPCAFTLAWSAHRRCHRSSRTPRCNLRASRRRVRAQVSARL